MFDLRFEHRAAAIAKLTGFPGTFRKNTLDRAPVARAGRRHLETAGVRRQIHRLSQTFSTSITAATLTIEVTLVYNDEEC